MTALQPLHPLQHNTPTSATSEYAPPLGAQEFGRLVGLRKGIQGDSRIYSKSSCVESTLFATFSCTDLFDYLLHFEDEETPLSTGTRTSLADIRLGQEIQEIQKRLRENIVFPLRRSFYFHTFLF